MNYDHSYHAGSFTDVFKHIVLIGLIEKLKEKEKAFFYLDTHSAYPEYFLKSKEALATSEAKEGIEKLLALSCQRRLASMLNMALIQKYLSLLTKNMYPGSPAIAVALTRPQDRLALNELMHAPYQALKKSFHKDARVHIHQQDAYTSLNALLPPKEKRGLILIDPPYENPQEYEALVKALTLAVKKFPQGIYAIWYPIKEQRRVDQFLRQMKKIPAEQLNLTCCPFGSDVGQRLSGSGMLILNPPWKFAEEMQPIIQCLEQVFRG